MDEQSGLYHSWFNRYGFDELIFYEWNSFGQHDNRKRLLSHEKLKGLKDKIKVWLRDTKNTERRHKEEVLVALKNLEIKIDSITASSEDRVSRTKLLYEINKIDKLETLDLHQKSRIKWDVEGDENFKFFHGLVNQIRRTNSIPNIMSDGTWVANPLQVKETFLNFFKLKLQPHKSMIDLPSITFPSNLISSDHDILEKDVTLEEIKFVVWDCGNDKASEPDGFTFGFAKRYWELLKKSYYGVYDQIKACLESSRTSILVNGSPTSEFSVKRGLRQGDPLYPFLFIIVMEGLYMALSEAFHSGLLYGIKIVFYLASGLKINIYKSNVYGVGVSDNEVHSMATDIGFSPGSFPFTYLGLPIGANMNLTEGGFGLNDISSKVIWSKIVGSSNFLHSIEILPSDSIRFRVGCGTSIGFWKDL
uniref:RNA-directed DNA polymerase, eukaryota n=1 Tax=Tanacetum cinerariifolium TaxID=118510 RepID=A0A6L2KQ78_TANCI|nr:RNA-directed DNA polymerase, eukaryota [Tanacetum cinerariifolium]